MVIIGAGSSAHDVAMDHVENDVGEVVRYHLFHRVGWVESTNTFRRRCINDGRRTSSLRALAFQSSPVVRLLVPVWLQEALTISIAYHEGGPPPAIPDLITSSYPRLVARSLMQGATHYIGNLDRCVRSVLFLNVPFLSTSKGATR